METVPRITDCKDLAGKYVIVRGGLNVPVENGVVTNQFRIARMLPTLQCLVSAGARVILMGHIGRDPAESLKPVHELLSESFDVVWAGALTGAVVTELRNNLQDGQILLLENTRSDEREKTNEASLAQELAALADIYVDDGFAAAHRAHTSVVGVPAHLPGYAGINFIHEYNELKSVMTPEHPSLFILGGAKFDTKMPLVEKYLEEYDHVLIAGALANDFFKAKGLNVGVSLTSDIDLSESPLVHHPKVLLPTDVVVSGPDGVRTTSPEDVHDDESILDAGPATIEMLTPYINNAKTILWNGPLGNYEDDFEEGTVALARAIAAASAYAVVGGGDTVASIESLGLSGDFGFMSTGGGAMLTFLEHGTLPAVEALLQNTSE